MCDELRVHVCGSVTSGVLLWNKRGRCYNLVLDDDDSTYWYLKYDTGNPMARIRVRIAFVKE